MSRRVCHMEKSRILIAENFGNGMNRLYLTEYWCGKSHRSIEEDPCILSEREQKAHDKFVAREAANPTPICGKCFRAKRKSKETE